MPGMDGLDLLGEIKRRYPELPVMMVTAYGDDERRRRAADFAPGRRPKSLEGGNRGGVFAGGGVGLWGCSAGVCFDVSSTNREGRLSK